eukprot:scaffold35356_cov44-Cyclotella_meneghiniana.AAC.2
MSDSSPLERGLKVLAERDSDMFIPKKLEAVKYGGTTLMAYPEVDHNSPAAERVFALMINKQAAESQYLDVKAVINFYASRVGLESHARVAVSQWTSRLKEKWNDPANLTVLSYHSATGAVIPNAIDPATGTLREITDGAVGTRRPAGVRLALVQCSISFDDLHYDNAPTTLRVEYFIPLPVGNVTFLNVAGNPVTINTCTVQGNPFGLTKEQFKAQVTNPCGVTGPIKLKTAEIGATDCAFNEPEKAKELNERIINLGAESIFRKLREQLAPTFSSTPHSTVEKIAMSFGEGGNKVTLTVLEYHQAIMRAAQTFLEESLWPFNLASHFANNLDPRIKTKFQALTTRHLTFNDYTRDGQLREIDFYLNKAIEVEKEVNSMKGLVREAMADTHSFCAQLMTHLGAPMDSNFDPAAAVTSTFLSAAEETLRKYAKSDPSNKHKYEETGRAVRQIICWGCKGGHRWRDPRTKEITCPNKDKPGIAQSAKQGHKDYLDSVKERKNGWIPKKKIKFSDLPPAQKEKARALIVKEATEIAAASVAAPAQGVSYPIFVYNSRDNNAPPLPAAIDNRLPHITITLGELATSIETCPQVRCLYDSGACVSSGYWGFWKTILENHPECIVDLFVSDGGQYSPIVLGGIVTGDDGDMAGHTCKLNIVVNLKLRYETITGQPVTHKIALGKDVGVNTILGMPFIDKFQCTYDGYNEVVEAKILDSTPFKVTRMVPQRYNTGDRAPSDKCCNHSSADILAALR